MAQTSRVGTVATSTFTDDRGTHVIYHNTAVVMFNHETIILCSGGWKTLTTKTRMNQASNQYHLGYQVYQEDFEWYVNYKGETLDFFDGITLER